MTYEPFAPTADEIKEMARLRELQEMWGVENSEEMELVLKDLYIARFKFINESPGYVGDLFVIQSGCLDSSNPPTRLIRGEHKALEVLS